MGFLQWAAQVHSWALKRQAILSHVWQPHYGLVTACVHVCMCVLACMHACVHAEQLTIGYIAVAGDPATVGCAPVHIIWLDIKHVLGGEGRPHHVPPCGVLHPLGLAC